MLTRLLLKIVFGNCLDSFLYIGARDQDAREKKAAAEIEGAFRPESGASQEEQNRLASEAAAKYKVSASRIKTIANMQAQGPQHYGYSPGKATSSNVKEVVKDGKTTHVVDKEKNKIYTATIAGRKVEGTKDYVDRKIRDYQKAVKARAEETFKKQQAKKAQESNALLVSQKFYDLYEQRKPEIERILKEEAGNKAMDQLVMDIKKRKAEERKGIEEAKAIWTMKPSIEKLKKYYYLWATKPKEFEAAMAELRHEAILAEDQGKEWQLSAAKPFTYVRQHPVKTAFVVGAVAGPGIALASKIPGFTILSSKGTAAVLSLAYGAVKGYEAGKKVREHPLDYARPSSILEIGSELPVELFAFSAGQKTGQAVIRGPALIGNKIKEIKLTRAVKGKTASQAKRILINELQIGGSGQKQLGTKALSTNVRVPKGKGMFKQGVTSGSIKNAREVSVKLRVKDVEGFKAAAKIKTSKGQRIAIGKYKPIYSKSYLIDPSKIMPHDAVMVTAGAEIKGYVLPNVNVKGGKALIPGSGNYGKTSSTKFVVSNKVMQQYFLKPRQLTTNVGKGFKGTKQEWGVSSGRFEPVKLDTYSGSPYKSISNQQPKLEHWFAKLTGQPTPSQVSYTYKIGGPDVIWKPVITESGEALGSYKINVKTQKIEFVTAGRGTPKKINPFVSQPAPQKSQPVVEVGGGTGHVSLQKVRVVEGVKVKQNFQKQETIFAPLKSKSQSKSKTESKSDTKSESVSKQKKYTVYDSITENRFQPIQDVMMGSKSKLAILSIPSSKKASSSKTSQVSASVSKLNIVQEEDIAQMTETIPAVDVSSALDTTTDLDFVPRQKTTLKPKSPQTTPPDLFGSPKPSPKIAILDMGKGEKGGEGSFNVLVRMKGVFKLIGSRKTAVEALSLGKERITHTAAASFKVIPAKGDANIGGIASRILSPSQFRMSKIEPGVFVEKKEKRIKTPGELREITFKGIFAQRMRSKKKKGLFSL